MADQKVPDVHLEVCSGFFRIPTEKVVYHITVLDPSGGSSDHISIPSPKSSPIQSPQAVPLASDDDVVDPAVQDNYYREAAGYFSTEISSLARQLNAMVGISSQTANDSISFEPLVLRMQSIQSVVASLSEEPPVVAPVGHVDDGDEATASLVNGIQGVQDQVEQLKTLLKNLEESGEAKDVVPQESPPADLPQKTRYLFDLDTVFQTIYELCTNETVKEHSQNARSKAADIFNLDSFLDDISEKVPTYTEDDGFLSVPLNDVLFGLANSCSDKKVVNLLKNMNKQQAEIFLDQFLPLEVPPTEEVGGGEQVDEKSQATDSSELPKALPKYTEVHAVLTTIDTSLAALLETAGNIAESQPVSTATEGREDSDKLEQIRQELIGVETELGQLGGKESHTDSKKENEKFLEIAVKLQEHADSFVTCLAKKEEDPDLSFSSDSINSEQIAEPSSVADTLMDAEKDVDSERERSAEGVDDNSDYEDGFGDDDLQEQFDQLVETEAAEPMDASTENIEEPLELPGEEKVVEESDDFGEASQDDIDKLLEEMGG